MLEISLKVKHIFLVFSIEEFLCSDKIDNDAIYLCDKGWTLFGTNLKKNVKNYFKKII